jgi:GDP-mannose 6-dehydrogenase
VEKGIQPVNIAVFGMGYVGVVSAACLARDGHRVVGVDPVRVKTDMINRGESPIVEPGLKALIEAAVNSGHLRATDDYVAAVAQADVMLICVGTPGKPNGSLDLGYVARVATQIGEQLATTPEYKVVAIRSTMLPGSMEETVIPTLESASGRKAGRDFGVCINPEFLREGSAILDYDNPPKTVIGAAEPRSAEALTALYANLSAPLIVTDLQTAEMVKYADNTWHALKVTFANEIGRLCKALDIDSRELMRLFCRDTKLNVSTAYLRPGFAFGGSCLPKDLRALTYKGKQLDVDTPVLSSVLASNQLQIAAAHRMIEAAGGRRVGLLGLSFKEGTDDLRESPIVALAEQLIGKGYELKVYDRNVQLASLVGANRDYILNHIPHIGRLLVGDVDALLSSVDVIVLATGEKEFGELAARSGPDQVVVDLVGIWQGVAAGSGRYDGIGW